MKQFLNVTLKFLVVISFLKVSTFTYAGGTPDPGTGNSRDNQLLGSFNDGNGPAGGDFVNAAGTSGTITGLNSDWLYNIEVPPSQTNLTVEIFDADVRGKFAPGGAGFSAEIHDTSDQDDANGIQAVYTLINPLGATVATRSVGQLVADVIAFDNQWAVIDPGFSVANPIPGHWQLVYSLDGGTGTDVAGNTYGVRAHDGTPGAGGTEFNMYSPTYVPFGHGEDTDSTNPGSEDQDYYPYVTRGCTVDVNDFDADGFSSYTLTSPTNDVFPSTGISPGTAWLNTEFDHTDPNSAMTADEYGLWNLFFDGVNFGNNNVGQNLGAIYVGDETTLNPIPEPTTNPISNAFRIYFPADGSAYANGTGTITDPTLPFITHSYSQTAATGTVTVSIINPARANGSTALPIEFDAATTGTNIVTITIPTNGGASIVTAGSDNPSQGNSQIAGNTVTWAPGTVSGSTTQTLTFDIDLIESISQGPLTIVDSTSAIFVDQTCAGAGCTGAQLATATTTFGPLCPLTSVQLPVTLSSFSSARSGNYVDIDWGTSSELFNVGFQLWGLDGSDGQWEKLHNWLVRSGSGNAVEPQSYGKRVKVPSSIDQLVSVGLSNVDSDGSEHYYGPFEVGMSYGELSSLKPIAWDAVRDELDARMRAQGYVRDRHLAYRQVSSGASSTGLPGDEESVVEFGVSQDGMYRLTSAQLLSAGIDWREVRSGDIAVLDGQGTAVVRYAVAKGTGYGLNKTLGSGGEIYFYGQGADESAGLYTDTSVYRLVLDRYQALQAPMQAKQGLSGGLSRTYVEYSEVEVDRTYVLNSEVDDPWVDRVVLGYSDLPGLYGALLPVEADAQWGPGSRLHIQAGRGSGLSAVDGDGDGNPDAEHIAQGLLFSGGSFVEVGNAVANGPGQWDLAFDIPAQVALDRQPNGDVVVGGSFSAGAGYAFSEVHIDSIGLSYTRPLVSKAGDDHLLFSGSTGDEPGYEVVVPDTGWPWVFASDGTNLVRLWLEGQSKQTSPSGDKQRRVQLSVLQGHELADSAIHYWVSGKPGYLSVDGLSEKTIVSQDSLLTQAQGNNHLIIAHPTFMGAAADGVDYISLYADHKRGQGHVVSVVNYLDVVQAYGGGQSGPHGLTAYLSEVEGQGTDIESVLIVGGSVYDHTDKLKTGALTFIPGHYGTSNYSNFTVSDVPYVTAAQGGLFASIGRWPVRSMADVQTIVTKSIQWGNTDHSSGDALLIAEHTVEGENIDFGSALDSVASTLPEAYTQRRVYVDQIMVDDPGLSLTDALVQAKGDIIDELNDSVDVVLYNGHASTRQLSNQNLFKASDVDQITGSGAQMWVPLSCYVTYYESTHVDTLAHQLLFSGSAVNITGAMLLSNQGENIQMGSSILNDTLNNGQSLGSAVNQAKADQNNPNLNINWATLGDPTAVF